MVIKSTLEKDEPITEKDIKMIEDAKNYPIVYDEDSPELTPEMEKAFRVAAEIRESQGVTLPRRPQTAGKA